MTIRVGINGFGRIGRSVVRAVRAQDNEWGYANRLVDLVTIIGRARG
jgi:glyceraldehyde-3-phosphate dehydrogenase/erythrose-4-phosphate dehydrogenase